MNQKHKCLDCKEKISIAVERCMDCRARFVRIEGEKKAIAEIAARGVKAPSGLVDSGTRETYGGGGQREVRDPEKGRYDLIPSYSHHRLAVHYARGSLKYQPRNWEKGLPLSTFIDSAERHLSKYKAGDRSEDHLAAIAWNSFGLIWTENEIREGRLPKELDDGPSGGYVDPRGGYVKS